jgi:hypothetical protein
MLEAAVTVLLSVHQPIVLNYSFPIERFFCTLKFWESFFTDIIHINVSLLVINYYYLSISIIPKTQLLNKIQQVFI